MVDKEEPLETTSRVSPPLFSTAVWLW